MEAVTRGVIDLLVKGMIGVHIVSNAVRHPVGGTDCMVDQPSNVPQLARRRCPIRLRPNVCEDLTSSSTRRFKYIGRHGAPSDPRNRSTERGATFAGDRRSQ